MMWPSNGAAPIFDKMTYPHLREVTIENYIMPSGLEESHRLIIFVSEHMSSLEVLRLKRVALQCVYLILLLPAYTFTYAKIVN